MRTVSVSDQGGRLVSATASKTGTAPLPQSYSETYSYTAAAWGAGASMDNIESVSDANGTAVYANTADRVTDTINTAAPVDPARSFSFTYDQAGRLVRKSGQMLSNELEGYSYDIQDQLTQSRVAGLDTEFLEYDPAGLPLFRKVGTKGTWYIGTNATVTAEVSATCTGTASCTPTTTPSVQAHVLLGGTRIASLRPGNPGAAGTAYDEILYYHRDQQGSVVATTWRNQGIDGLSGARYRYIPYGQLDKVDGVSAATDSELGYTGGLRLGYVPGVVASLTAPQARGLVLLGARVYHAELKRWLQADTVDRRRYTYTGGDPVNFTDRSGRRPMGGDSGSGGSGGGGFTTAGPVGLGIQLDTAITGRLPQCTLSLFTADPGAACLDANGNETTAQKWKDGFGLAPSDPNKPADWGVALDEQVVKTGLPDSSPNSFGVANPNAWNSPFSADNQNISLAFFGISAHAIETAVTIADKSTGVLEKVAERFSKIPGTKSAAWATIGRIAKRVAIGFTVYGLGKDINKLYNGKLRTWHFLANQASAASGAFGGGWGLAIDIAYTAGDELTEGGYEGVMDRAVDGFNMGFVSAEQDVWRAYGASP